MKKSFKTIIALLLSIFLFIPTINASAATKLERVKKSLHFYDENDNLQGHTEEDLLTRNYDFNKNAKFTSNDKLMYRFALAYAVRNTASRDKGKLYTNEWFEAHYKEILDKAYAGADTTVDFYKDKDKKLCIKIHMDGIYLDWGFRDAIRTEIIKDMAECGVVIPRNRISVTSSKKENAKRINPCPGLSNTLLSFACAADSIQIDYWLNGTTEKGNPGVDNTTVTMYVNSKFQEAIHEYAIANNMTEFKACMRLFNALEFDNLIDIQIYFTDYAIDNEGISTESGPKSERGIGIWKFENGNVTYDLIDNATIYNVREEKTYTYEKGTAYNWIYDLQHQ